MPTKITHEPVENPPAQSLAEIMAALAAPTPKSEVKTRPGRGKSGDLSYVDARFVMDRLDSVVGPMNWSDQYLPVDGGVECTIRIHVGDAFASKSDVGVPSTIEPVKGAYSDAFKRAAVKWGIGRDLYDEDSEARSTKTPVSAHRETVEKVEQAVVGQRGLTGSQRGKLFATLQENGYGGKSKRRYLVLASTGKQSVTEMTKEDLDKVLAIFESPDIEPHKSWLDDASILADD